jgi:hypothetical protein
MRKACLAMILVATALAPVYGQEDMSKAKEWCTDAHMTMMNEHVGKMTDAAAKKTAMDALDKSKTAMEHGDMKGCLANMEEAHKAMGM